MTFFPQCDTQAAIGYASRKRKEMEEEAGGNGQINIAERRKVSVKRRVLKRPLAIELTQLTRPHSRYLCSDRFALSEV